MTRKKLMVLSVGAACAWPMLAHAHWEVTTPSAVDESAPHLTVSRSHLGTVSSAAAMETRTASESAHSTVTHTRDQTSLSASELRNAQGRARRASMPNPQTPWSPSESGPNRYAEDMQAYRQHVASLEQARTTAAASYDPLIALAEAPPPAPEAPVASADSPAARPETVAVGTEPRAAATQTSIANTPVGNAEAKAEVDRLLANPETPSQPREAVVTANPALLDTRQSGLSQLRVESTGGESGGNASASPVPQQPEISSPTGGTAEPATVVTLSGSSSSTTEASAGQAGTVSAVELPPAPEARATPPESASASAQASSGTTAQ